MRPFAAMKYCDGESAHQLFRLVVHSIVNTSAGDVVDIYEIELAEEKGGPNIAGSATFTAGSTGPAGSGPTALNDGNFSTFWETNSTGDANRTIQIDFGATAANWRRIKEIRIFGSTSIPQRSPASFDFDYYDPVSATWVNVLSASGVPLSRYSDGLPAVFQSVDCPAGAAGYLFYKLDAATTANSRGFLGCAELKLKASGVDQTVRFSHASSTFSSNSLDLAYDGNAATFYSSGDGSMPETLVFMVTSKAVVNSMTYTARNDTFANDAIASGTLYGSNDNVNFTSLIPISGATSWATGETKTFS